MYSCIDAKKACTRGSVLCGWIKHQRYGVERKERGHYPIDGHYLEEEQVLSIFKQRAFAHLSRTRYISKGTNRAQSGRR